MTVIRAFLIFILFLSLALPAVGSVKELHITPEEPVKGDVVTLYGKAKPDEEVKIDVSFQREVDVQDGEYSFSLDGVKIPEGNNRFTVVARGCEDLKVSVKILIWLTLSSNAKDGVAKITKSAPPGKYDIVIHGKSDNSSVNLKIIATGYVKANKDGEFSYSYDTSSIPPGEFLVSAGGVNKQIKLLAEPPAPTPTPTPTFTPTPTLTPTPTSSRGSEGVGGAGGSTVTTETTLPTVETQLPQQENNTANANESVGQTPRQSPTKLPTPEATAEKLQDIDAKIEPESIAAKPGDQLNYKISLDWGPKEWHGNLDITLIVSAHGFEKKYSMSSVSIEEATPPITKNISLKLPKNIPPATYNAKVEISADSLKTNDSTNLEVNTPGFEVIFALAGLIATYLIRRR